MKKLPGSVWLLGVVSFFNDTASEMLYPVLPIFITQVLGAPVAVLGLIDGVAEGSAAVFKTVFGRWSDRLGKRKPFVFFGYVASTLSKLVVALSRTWGLVLVGRVLDKFGKGIRTGARDAMLLDASDPTNRGLVFGFQQSLDSAGAVVGPLIALVLLHTFRNDIRTVLYIAAIPSIIGVFVVAFVRERRHATPDDGLPDDVSRESADVPSPASAPDLSPVPRPAFGNLPRELKVFLVASGLFALGNSSDSFLILRSRSVGLSLTMVILAYVVYNVVYSAASTPAGSLADRFGARRVYVVGIIIYVGVYVGFALNRSAAGVWLLFAAYGFYIAMTDSVSRALVGGFITDQSEAAGIFGLLQTIISVGLVLASVIGGILWTVVGAWATFSFAALCAVLALSVFLTAGVHRAPSAAPPIT
jgi:MFS family permease